MRPCVPPKDHAAPGLPAPGYAEGPGPHHMRWISRCGMLVRGRARQNIEVRLEGLDDDINYEEQEPYV
jgi:hypothetical protein